MIEAPEFFAPPRRSLRARQVFLGKEWGRNTAHRLKCPLFKNIPTVSQHDNVIAEWKLSDCMRRKYHRRSPNPEESLCAKDIVEHMFLVCCI